MPDFAFSAKVGPHLPTPEGWKAELAYIGTTTASKQSAQDRYVTEITVISCSDRHASPDNWKPLGYERRTHDLSDRKSRR